MIHELIFNIIYNKNKNVNKNACNVNDNLRLNRIFPLSNNKVIDF